MPILGASSQKRRTFQASLFLLAVVAPCLLLVALSILMVRQDRELTAKRTEDQRRLTVERARQALLLRLERLKLEAVGEEALMAGESQPEDSPIALTARLVDGRSAILFLEYRAQRTRLMRVSATGGSAEAVGLETDRPFRFDVSPDGKRFVYSSRSESLEVWTLNLSAIPKQ